MGTLMEFFCGSLLAKAFCFQTFILGRYSLEVSNLIITTTIRFLQYSSKKIELWVKFDHATTKKTQCVEEKMVKHLWRGAKTASRDGFAQATSLNHKVGTHEGKADVGTGRALRSRASAKASDLRRELHPQALFIKFSFRSSRSFVSSFFPPPFSFFCYSFLA